jgi:putative membrane protein
VFLGLLCIGAAIGIKGFGEVLKWALEEHRAATMLFFMGLILGSLPPVIRMGGMKRFRAAEMTVLAVGVLAVLALGDPRRKEEAKADVTARVSEQAQADATPAELDNPDYVTLGVCGFAAGSAMIVPGVSGSLVMLLLDKYYTVIVALHALGADSLISLAKGIFSSAPLDAGASSALAAIKILCVVGVMAGLGVLVFAKIIEIALAKAPSLTHALIIGLVGGSIVALNPGMPRTLGAALMAAFCLIAGTLISCVISSHDAGKAAAEHPASAD